MKRLYALCDELEIDRRSTHKIRKTTLSKMLDVCLKQDIADISAIRAVAGHVDETTLLKNYLFSTRKDEMPQLITTVLSSDAWKHFQKKQKKRETFKIKVSRLIIQCGRWDLNEFVPKKTR